MAKKEKVKLNKFEKWFRSLHRFRNMFSVEFTGIKSAGISKRMTTVLIFLSAII